MSNLPVDTKRWLIRILIELTGRSASSIAGMIGVHRSGLTQWLKGRTTLGSESQDKVLKVLGIIDVGLDYKVGKLLPGIHRWTVPSPLIEDVLQTESIVQKFLPGGGTIYPVRRENRILNKLTTESYVPWSPWIRLVLVPLSFPDVRVILKMGEKVKQLINPFDNHTPDPFRMEGWVWPDGSKGTEKEEIKKTLWVDLPEERFLRLSGDENLSGPDLDELIGISGSRAWTWEKLFSALKAKGIPPEEIARSQGLL